jgi:hypothetical protein
MANNPQKHPQMKRVNVYLLSLIFPTNLITKINTHNELAKYTNSPMMNIYLFAIMKMKSLKIK